ncbi:MAG TPA: hypothetical protein VFV50_10445 [Bdellovibrionales bacterium]|nr:hypothetical protein [Bdellovibrionales bacterium]
MLIATLTPVHKIKPLELIRVRQMLSRKTPLDDAKFKDRLAKLDQIILLREKNRLKGVATIKKFRFKMNGRTALGVLNDESIVEGNAREREHLAGAFHRYLWYQRLQHPFTSIFWVTLDSGNGSISPVLEYMSRQKNEVVALTERPDGNQLQPLMKDLFWALSPDRAYFGTFRAWTFLSHRVAAIFRSKSLAQAQ